ncbi:MAG: hypothetical protein Q3961_02845 [Bifidobacteriaceae bacterium]|nr:hypothetical protein [Bifidobacteriaceae bacterium]
MNKRVLSIALAGALGCAALSAPQATQVAHADTTTNTSGSSDLNSSILSLVFTVAIDVAIYNALVDNGLLRSIRR